MSLRRSLLSRTAPIDELKSSRPPIVLSNVKLNQEVPDVPAPVFRPREKYLDEAPSGRLGALLKQAMADHPELEPHEFDPRNITNWSVRVPGVVTLENGDQVQAELQVESHLVGFEELTPEQTAKGVTPEPIFSDRAELVVTGMSERTMAKPLIGYRYQNQCDVFMERRGVVPFVAPPRITEEELDHERLARDYSA